MADGVKSRLVADGAATVATIATAPLRHGQTTLIALAEKLERFVAMPEWQRFYMDKAQGSLCAAALRALAEGSRK